jgi:methyl-accepting chemotaxis protein
MTRSVADAAAGSGQISQNIEGVASSATQATDAVAAMGEGVAELTLVASNLRKEIARFTV